MMMTTALTDLFPPLEPNRIGFLPVSALHTLYWEESGNPQGVPVVFLHGGPGSGSSPIHRRFFDPHFYRIIIFDQRGSGRSTPHAMIEENTTQHLVADLERLRVHLGVTRWLVFGGSWGSTLALAYGQAYPERCLGFILRGIFLGRPQEIEWFFKGMGTIFPEAARSFLNFLLPSERHDPAPYYFARLMHPDPAIHMPAAIHWKNYESACASLIQTPIQPGGDDHHALALARLEAHYMLNGCFLPDGGLLAHLDRIRSHRAIIVQGRYDIVCPIVTADELARAWPEAEYVIAADSGHSGLDPSTRSHLVQATEKFKGFLAR